MLHGNEPSPRQLYQTQALFQWTTRQYSRRSLFFRANAVLLLADVPILFTIDSDQPSFTFSDLGL